MFLSLLKIKKILVLRKIPFIYDKGHSQVYLNIFSLKGKAREKKE